MLVADRRVELADRKASAPTPRFSAQQASSPTLVLPAPLNNLGPKRPDHSAADFIDASIKNQRAGSGLEATRNTSLRLRQLSSFAC